MAYHAIRGSVLVAHLLLILAKVPVAQYAVDEFFRLKEHDVIDTDVSMKNAGLRPRVLMSYPNHASES